MKSKKAILGLAVIAFCVVICLTMCSAKYVNHSELSAQTTQAPTPVQPSLIDQVEDLTNHNFSYTEGLSETEIMEYMEDITNHIQSLRTVEKQVMESAECYAYVELINDTIVDLQEILAQYRAELTKLEEERIYWQAKSDEYPIATQVWLYMKNNFGWSDTVCAGIMGNIMAEIGGGTLNFYNWNDNDKGPFGMFQWLGQREMDIKNIYGAVPSIEEQLEFMYDELYGTDGVNQQVTNNQREKILNAKTPEDVAIYFCIYFERPSGGSTPRGEYARIAYDYFVQ